ncbi:4-hydroxy-3-methylbut-2-enyl diphosphatereductase [Striga asiatica]|uniref:4-hydroxy-3-methylbut-2-enyl diphosphatereductase n=1 Tax=Striga asiatica TaxID=4170 RepID=A0A5A7Q021_STRAF|nr:4-hydroxy-3-methylbut-2-enyl diphosphatereductase [Striga asiatica]
MNFFKLYKSLSRVAVYPLFYVYMLLVGKSSRRLKRKRVPLAPDQVRALDGPGTVLKWLLHSSTEVFWCASSLSQAVRLGRASLLLRERLRRSSYVWHGIQGNGLLQGCRWQQGNGI